MHVAEPVTPVSATTLLADAPERRREDGGQAGPSGVAAMWCIEEGMRLVVQSRMGELTVHDFRTGEILCHTMLTRRLRGTRFSKDGDFSKETLEAISRAGGVIVD